MKDRKALVTFSVATVANATANSDSIDMMGTSLIAVVLTLAGTSIQGTGKVQASNDGSAWIDIGTTLTISAAGSFGFNIVDVGYALARVQVISTDADVITFSATATIKGMS